MSLGLTKLLICSKISHIYPFLTFFTVSITGQYLPVFTYTYLINYLLRPWTMLFHFIFHTVLRVHVLNANLIMSTSPQNICPWNLSKALWCFSINMAWRLLYVLFWLSGLYLHHSYSLYSSALGTLSIPGFLEPALFAQVPALSAALFLLFQLSVSMIITYSPFAVQRKLYSF